MDTKSSEWRPGPTVCRCCLTEGCYKDISTEYFWMGKREVYSEMLSDTFNVTIAYSQSGGPNSNSRLICEPCISRLRDACDFRRQVLECEKTFMQHLDPCSSRINDLEVPVVPLETDVKLERIKLETSDDDEFDDRDFDDDDDDMDDQPLTKLASKIPKKETVDILDLLDNNKAAEKRKSATKTKTAPAKKAKIVKKEPVKATASKVVPKTEKKKKERNPMFAAKRNAQTIIQYTTVYPFRLPESAMVCVYCCEGFDEGPLFRAHMDKNHNDVNIRVAYAHLHEGFIKADCSDIRCRICSEKFDEINNAAKHLNEKHDKKIDFEYSIGILPFLMAKDRLACAVCGTNCSNIRNLSRHIQEHFFKCTCELCGRSFAASASLQKHLQFACPFIPKQRRCRKCKIELSSTEDQNKHFEMSKKCRQHLCSVCGERFSNWKLKRHHMETAHGIPEKVYPCPECKMVFNKPNRFRAHFKIVHTTEHFECPSCDKKFDSKYILDRHMIVHSNERLFSCDICSKSFPRKYTLRQHMWIHSEVKQYECKACNKQFNQKVSWKTHMRSYHPDQCDF
ncbi:uncharacterized protein LOC142985076 isoform X16 [Anticarsia gemmatalis]|uniref:uncharacterized protein LOC142985076 isoform X16 n=1 Tax=Anticarsia gemmatalis TaxID=129554 RepID=UPI003F774B8D